MSTKVKISYRIFFALIFILGSFFVATGVQANESFDSESILSFISNISVNADNSVDVTENITYNTGPQARHGIYRDIYPYSSTGKKMDISNVSVMDQNHIPYMFTVGSSGQDVRIKIGDPNQTFSGEKTYIIKYHATNAVGQLKDVDEIYWNVTGNEWLIPIYNTKATVTLPNGAVMSQSACYFGPKGSKAQCSQAQQVALQAGSDYSFSSPASLSSGGGLTVAVGFQKGIVVPYSNTPKDKFHDFLNMYLGWIVAILLPIITLIFSLWYWYKKGRDPKGTGVIVPQYDVPDGLTPMEVSGIVKEKVQAGDISAEIIYLATQGYLKITQTESKILGLFNSTDYELTKLKEVSSSLNGFDKILLNGLFVGDAKIVKLSTLKYKFYLTVKEIITAVLEALLVKAYYKNLGRMKNLNTLLFVPIIMFVMGMISATAQSLSLVISVVSSIVLFVLVYRYSPAKTEKGVATKEYLLGLKMYLQIAEKDRLIFHNAPDKKPEVFEKLLPYAIALGVAGIWAKEFEGIYTTPPSWYVGPHNGVFNAVIFSHSLANFGAFANSSLASSPRGGSGGGGFSGGGGGGGGGGGW